MNVDLGQRIMTKEGRHVGWVEALNEKGTHAYVRFPSDVGIGYCKKWKTVASLMPADAA